MKSFRAFLQESTSNIAGFLKRNKIDSKNGMVTVKSSVKHLEMSKDGWKIVDTENGKVPEYKVSQYGSFVIYSTDGTNFTAEYDKVSGDFEEEAFKLSEIENLIGYVNPFPELRDVRTYAYQTISNTRNNFPKSPGKKPGLEGRYDNWMYLVFDKSKGWNQTRSISKPVWYKSTMTGFGDLSFTIYNNAGWKIAFTDGDTIRYYQLNDTETLKSIFKGDRR